ncbi:MAG: proton-conducting transporter membrane subunit [Bacteroidales bacterium]|jgi:formate hydrogenlyase subunit 3/multisubunit Na+/H+ antiporter MnhD subunit
MTLVIVFILICITGVFLIPFLKVKMKGIVALMAVAVNTLISGYLAVLSLTGQDISYSFPGSLITGAIPVRIDALSGWFILIVNFVFITGGWYGLFYMKAYQDQRKKITLHAIAFLLLHSAIISLMAIQNSIAFLVAWEIMMFSAFICVTFEHEKEVTLKAGINYLIQSHICVVLLVSGFLWVSYKTGSYDFQAISTFSSSQTGGGALFLFMLFFIAFSIKSGFVPFHTWLPYAHPAAPAHISGIMSGVLIKSGIYGIFRMLLLIKADFTAIGYIILAISVISGLYGVMLAIVQHDLKKLLAYHSVENIGIIGIGIGIGCIGLGNGNMIIASLGFAGALLHTLNHALFKSLLFYTAGMVYQATHTLNIEHLGGLIKKMPQTAILFLIAAVAISGIPPFNGFISEFIIYTGLYQWMQVASLGSLIVILSMVLGLVLIGGLALLCFTKAFGIVFLGNARKELRHEVKEGPIFQFLPLYLIAFFILFIGLFPQLFLNILKWPVGLFTGMTGYAFDSIPGKTFEALNSISWAMWGLILTALIIFSIRKLVLHKRPASIGSTWGCGYVAPTAKLQYTAGSFVRAYVKLNKPTLLFSKNEKGVDGLFPAESHYESHAYDKLEKWLIDKPVKVIKSFLKRFSFLQNGSLQSYILYGVLFIIGLIFIPMILDKISLFIDFLKHL